MICKFCGQQIPDGSTFCNNCGSYLEPENNNQAPFVDPYAANAYQENEMAMRAKDALGGQILTWGILGLAFSTTFIFSLLGLIFSCVARSKIKQYIANFGPTEGKASVGKGLSTAGFIVGIIMTIFFALYVLLIVMIIALTSATVYY